MQRPELMNLSLHDPKTGLVRVVIDTPRGSRNKYKFDADLGIFKLSRILPAGMSFPFDFGSIPGTYAEDGDALDILVLNEAPLVVGCLVQVRLVGIIRATQKEGRATIRNDRLLGAIETPLNKPVVRDIHDLSKDVLNDVEHFFCAYNEAQGRTLAISGRAGAKAAESVLRRALRAAAGKTRNR